MPVPANDDFANATNLTGTSGTVPLGDIELATRESGEPGEVGFTHTVWWKHTATQDGLLEVLIRGVTDDDAGSTYLGAYTGTVLTSLTVVAYSDYTNFDGIGSAPTNAVYNSLRFVIESGTTYYVQAEDAVTPHTDKEIVWREVALPSRSVSAMAVTGATELAEAMRNFTGSELPSATDANGGRWAVPPGYNVNATATVESNGLLFDGHLVSPGSGIYVQSYVLYVDPADDETEWLVSIGGDLMYECGFQMGGATTSTYQNFYFYWDELSGSARIGWWLSQEPGNTDMLLYFLLGNFDAGGWTIVPVDWPIRVRLVYDADGSTTGYQWNGYVSVDGGATWLWQMGVDGTLSGNNFRSFGPQLDGHGGDPAWSVLLEGWGEVAEVSLERSIPG